MTSRRTALKLGAAVAGGFMINRGALAADSIRLIVPWGKGGHADQLYQLIQEPFAKAMGMPVVIDIVTGDGSKLATQETIRSKPGSRTLLIHLPDLLALWEFEGDNLLADLRPVAKLTRGMSQAFCVREDSALKDWQGMSTASKNSGLTITATGGGCAPFICHGQEAHRYLLQDATVEWLGLLCRLVIERQGRPRALWY